MKVITTDNASATQTEHPWRATVRTLIQTALGAGLTIVGILIFVPGALDEFAAALGDLGIVIPAAVIALPPVIARIMAIPGIEKALRTIGAGAAPTELTFGDWTGADADEVVPVDDEPTEDDVADGEDAEPEGLADDEESQEPAFAEVIYGEEDAEPEGPVDDEDPEALAAAEVDDTPPPEGYQPRH